MKKALPYILGGVLLLLLVVIMLVNKTTQERKMDERITLRQRDKNPYGTRVAHDLLHDLYPNASLPFDSKVPGVWDSIDVLEANQAVILMADYLDADDEELKDLSRFVNKGNYVFIIARSASDDVRSFFGLDYTGDYYSNNYYSDSLQVKLESPSYTNHTIYTYPGKKYEGVLKFVNDKYTSVLGRNQNNKANFIQINRGKGSFFIHTAPLAFSNYFILHKNNSAYYQQVFSVFPKNVSTILWNEYYLEKIRSKNNNEPNWLSALLSYPSFKWGLIIGALTLLLFTLLGMRRKQRMIPPHTKPHNDSLDFVKTLGRLYYDRKDHKNLATKMSAYFLEHVRSVYKIPTHTLNAIFIQTLHFKSGYPEEEIQRILHSIEHIQTAPVISEKELADFHKQLELFYQNT